jgi:peptide/nickel transport system permease protein
MRGPAALAFSLFLAITASFFALRLLPGDAIESRLRQSNASPAAIAAQRAQFGLDQPLMTQYVQYWRGLLQGDLGYSLVTRESAASMIRARLWPTLELAGLSLALGGGLGLALGSLAALGRAGQVSPMWAPLAEGLSSLALAAPTYWTATLAIFAANRWLPPEALPSASRQLLLAVVVLGYSLSGPLAQITEGSLREQLGATFMQTARAKGLGLWGRYRHALRAAWPPILSTLALQAGFALSGTVIIETIFTRRGLGSLLYQSVLNQDYALVQALVCLSAGFYVLSHSLVRALSHLADPRL